MNFTFGIITHEKEEDRISKIIDSIEAQNIPDYEIIVVGSCNLERKNLKVIPFDETIKPMWITRKKNIITVMSTKENIVYLHDYFMFEDGWYEGQLKSGNDFSVRVDKVVDIHGNRFMDWVLCPFPQIGRTLPFVGMDCHIPYDMTHLSKYMFIIGHIWTAKRDFMMKYPLNDALTWGQGEDIEWSRRIREVIDFKMNTNSSVRLLKEKDRGFGFPTPQMIEQLKQIR